jgi:hypothetical protein
MPSYGTVPLDHFSSTCYYFGEALAAQREGTSTQTSHSSTVCTHSSISHE